MNKTVDIFPFQQKILLSKSPVTVAICGRSSGKSHGASIWAIKKAMECRGMGLVVAPTYDQAKTTMKYIMTFLNEIGVEWTYNKAPTFAKSVIPDHKSILSMNINGELKQMKMASADIEDNLRSGSYSWILVDEACYISEEAFHIMMPTLRGQGTDFTYQIMLISSPAGKNWVYSSFLENPDSNTTIIQAPSWENVLQVDDTKLNIWKNTMSSRMYQQEIMAEILDTNLNAIFYAFTTEIIKPCSRNGGEVIVSLDQNTSPGCGVIIEQRGDEYFVMDEIYIDDGANYISYVQEIMSKVPKDIKIILKGDASGNARNVAALATFYTSVIDELEKNGYRVDNMTNKSNPKVYESRERVNMLIENNRLVIDSKCKHLIKDMELAEWKPDKVFETYKTKYDPHVAEAMVYGVWDDGPLWSPY